MVVLRSQVVHYFFILSFKVLFTENKRKKSDFIDTPKDYLMKSLFGNSDKKINPGCGGYYNTTDGAKV